MKSEIIKKVIKHEKKLKLESQVFICVECLNTWDSKGFEVKEKSNSFTCKSCGKEYFIPSMKE